MHKGDLDTYIATFKHLARDAGYDTNTASTVNMFAQNLETGLLSSIMHREHLPITFTEWIAAARREKENYEMRQAMMHPQRHQFKWQVQKQPQRNGHRYHDESVPMDPWCLPKLGKQLLVAEPQKQNLAASGTKGNASIVENKATWQKRAQRRNISIQSHA